MDYPLKILRKHLANEKKWLQSERLGSVDPKYKAGAQMAKQRIPQLEDAIQILKTAGKPVAPAKKKNKAADQLTIFKQP